MNRAKRCYLDTIFSGKKIVPESYGNYLVNSFSKFSILKVRIISEKNMTRKMKY